MKKDEKTLQLLTSNFMEGRFPNEFYQISFWEKVNNGRSETTERVLFRYQYLDFKLEILFNKQNERIRYIMLEIFPDEDDINNKIMPIIDDIQIFKSKNELTIKKKEIQNGKLELYYDEDDKYLTSIYYIP